MKKLLLAAMLLIAVANMVFSQENYSSWSFYRNIVLNTKLTGANITANVTKFPVLIRLNGKISNGGNANDSMVLAQSSFASTNGQDIRFSKYNGTQFTYQRERWDATNGYAEFWVLVDTVFGNDSTGVAYPNGYLKMYWGKSTAVDNGLASGAVFDTANGYAAVWHLQDTTDATYLSGGTAGATNNFPLTSTSKPISCAGMIGVADTFNGSANFLHTVDSALTATKFSKLNYAFGGPFTLSAWVWNRTNAQRCIVTTGDFQYALQQNASSYWEFADYDLTAGVGTWYSGRSAAAPTQQVWHHVVGVRDTTSAVYPFNSALYVDGVLVSNTAVATTYGTTARSSGLSVTIGKQGNAATRWWRGRIDEVEISNVARSANWVRLSYANQFQTITNQISGLANGIDSLTIRGEIISTLIAPVLTAPANAAVNVAVAPTLTWGTIASAATYRVQVSTESAFATPIVDDSTLTAGLKSVSGLNNVTTYFWRSNAKNATGTSAWSTIFSFTTVAPAPVAPTLLTPANVAVNIAVMPTLTWGTVTGAATYRVQIAAVSDFSTVTIDDSTLTAGTKTLTTALSGNATYYWRANAKNPGGTSAWSTAFSFTTVPAAPGTPTLMAPANAAINVVLAPTLTWGTVPGAATYRIQLSTNSVFGTTVADDSTLSVGTKAITGLANSTTYYWRVNSKNPGGTSAWQTAAFSFTTLPVVPVTPALMTPTIGQSFNTNAVTLTWGTVTGAATYRVQVSTVSTFTTTVTDDSTLTVGTKALSSLTNGTYYWRVNSKNAGGTSAYSAPFNFIVNVVGIATAKSHYVPVGMGHNGVLEVYLANGSRVMELAYSASATKAQLLNTASKSLAKGYYTYRFRSVDAKVEIVGKLVK